MTLFAAMTLVGSVLVIFLPETHKSPLPQTLEDAENWGKRQANPESAVKYCENAGMDINSPDETI